MQAIQGNVSKAYIEIDPRTQQSTKICLYLDDLGWIEFTQITLRDGFVLPAPLGCKCVVEDISERKWEHANFEISFASSYSDEGTFFAKVATPVNELR